MPCLQKNPIYVLSSIIVLSVVAGFFAVWLMPHVPYSGHVHITESEALQAASSFLQAQIGASVDMHTQRPLLTTDWVSGFFISDVLGGEQDSYRRNFRIPDFTYVCTVNTREGLSYTVSVDASTGDVVSWNIETIPSNLAAGTASDRASAYLENLMPSPSTRTLVSSEADSTTDLAGQGISVLNRTFAVEGSHLESSHGQGYATYEVRSVGDTIVGESYSYAVPEIYRQKAQAAEQGGDGLGTFHTIIYLCVLCAAIYVLYTHRRKVRSIYRTPLLLAAGVTVLILLETANGGVVIARLLGDMDTVGTVAPAILFGLVQVAVFALPLFLFLAAGYVLWGRDRVWHGAGSSESVHGAFTVKSVYAGYVVGGGAVALAFLTMLFDSGDLVGNSLKDFEYLIATHLPAFSVFSMIALIPALVEEVTYRLFVFGLVAHHTGSRLLGALIATLLWVVLHVESFDLLELMQFSVVGTVLMFTYMRYGLAASICAHYVLNVLLGAILLGSVFILDVRMMLAVVGMAVVPAVLALSYLVFVRVTHGSRVHVLE